IFAKGELFGEVPMFAGGSYPAHAETLEATRVLFFPREAFLQLLRKEPSLALNMLGILSQRLRRFTHLIEDLSLKEVPGRLAAYLLYLSNRRKDSDAFELDITKAQLASFLGTIPETLSRILSRMSQQGLIWVEGRRIRLLNRNTLESLASGEKLLSQGTENLTDSPS
ncbi:MAG TPA: Crp/Fnr family transcriptional regulator, partial [Syntrophobacteraceae bacterium]|nr:Crp/Fnr family transcriptional regulator [Syntrophobacteraceae bacterium]